MPNNGTIFADCPLYQRAWVIQERILSSRVLHCGKLQFTWRCRELDASEMYPISCPDTPWRNYEQLMSQRFTHLTATHEVNEHPSLVYMGNVVYVTDRDVYWRLLVQAYTKCDLTKPSDKLVAIAGLAEALIPQNKYFYGIIQVNLPRALLWRTSPARLNSPPCRRAQIWRAPSWSWASIDGGIDYNFPGDIGEDYSISEAHIETVLLGCCLRVKGKLRPAMLNGYKTERSNEQMIVTKTELARENSTQNLRV